MTSTRRVQLKLRYWLRRPIVAFIILALATGYSIGYTHYTAQKQTQSARQAALQHSNENRAQVSKAVRNVFEANCRLGNKTRYVLRGLIQEETPLVSAAVKQGRLSPQEGRDALKRIKADISKVQIANCHTVAQSIK